MEVNDMALQKHNRIWDFQEKDHFRHNSPPPPAGVEFMAYLIIKVKIPPTLTLGILQISKFSKNVSDFGNLKTSIFGCLKFLKT